MGVEIPVFFMPVDDNQAAQLESDEAVWELVGRCHDSRADCGLRSSTSRNFWHLYAAKRYAEQHQSDALSFLDTSTVVLKTPAIVQAIALLAHLMGDASHGVDRMPTTCTEDANAYFLQLDLDTAGSNETASEAFRRAYCQAAPTYDVEVTSDAGFGAAVDFFAFIKSLFQALGEALLQGKSLLFACPSY